MYSIGHTVSTLRYYDKEGLFPDLERSSGIRRFGDKEIEALRMIECLKSAGLEIKDIKQFMQWCSEGSSTYKNRLELFTQRKEAVAAAMAAMERTLSMLKFKCWYYEKAITDGNEDGIRAMIPDKFPPEIQKLYDTGHKK